MDTYLDFQAISWATGDVDVEASADSDSDGEEQDDDDGDAQPMHKTYIVDIYGKTKDGKSVCVHVPFKPYFFVEVPDVWNESMTSTRLVEDLRKKMARKHVRGGISGFKLVKRRKFFGFSNARQFSFCCIMFDSSAASGYAAAILKKKYTLYESNVNPMLRLMHMRSLETAGWIRVKQQSMAQQHDTRQPRRTRCDIEVTVSQNAIERLDVSEVAPLVIASFDIECVSKDGSFPNPKESGSTVIQIATTFQRYGESEPYRRHIVCLGDTSKVEGVDLHWVSSESALLLMWAQTVNSENTDVLVGYNIWGFDMQFIYERIAFNGGTLVPAMRQCLCEMGRSLKQAGLDTMTLSSSAYGNNEWKTIRTDGVLQIDLMQIIKKEFKLDSYKLDAVAEHFLEPGVRKIDMPIPEMFRLFRGSPDDRAKIAEYCVRDTELPLKLVQKLAIIPNMVEMAKATHVPMDFLLPRGQQIKVFSQILKKTRERGYLCPTQVCSGGLDDTYEGATVLDPKTGAYWGVVTCLDFASLYPSIMRAHNMCHSTIVMDKAYDNLPGIEYFEVDGTRFAQNGDGILPELLKDLADFRKKAKQDMAEARREGDQFKESLCNGRQLAYKVSMNSIYGFCGAAKGYMPCVPIASSVTTVGRDMIAKTRDMVHANFPGSCVVYGDTDSVMIDFGDKVELQRCFQLGEEAAALVTSSFLAPIELTFEKCYRPFLLFAKKRYAGLYYTRPDKPDKLDCKGIQLVRRDNCKIVKRVLGHVLDRVMYDRDVDCAIKYIRDAATDLLAGRVDVRELVLSKCIKASGASLLAQTSKSCMACSGSTVVDGDLLRCSKCSSTYRMAYKNAAQPHVVVACKLEKRSPGAGPNAGDRVPFLYVDYSDPRRKNALASSNAEDPEFVETRNLKIDYMYYLEHQLKKPVLDLMSIIIPNCEDRLFKGVGEEVYKRERGIRLRKETNRLKGQTEVTFFFKHKSSDQELESP
jgi:DNA polymerase delta subunit 1